MSHNFIASILVVEDEESLRNAIVFDFKRRGFSTYEATNGKDALQMINDNKIDVVLTDVRMPGGDGIELLDTAKAQCATLPVFIFITGFSDLTLEDAYDKGADAVFSKPFDRKKLLTAVFKALEKKEISLSKRLHERYDSEFNITLKFQELQLAIETKVLNLGRGGCFIAWQGPFPAVESKVVFKIQFDHGNIKTIEGTGIVRWTRSQFHEYFKQGCGIEFEYLSDASRNEVLDQISLLKTKAYIPKI